MLKGLPPCLAALLAVSLAGAAVLNLDAVSERTLPNGLQIIVKHEPHWGLVAAGLHVRCGSVHDPEGKTGASHLIEHLLFEAQNEGERGLGLAIESLGGHTNAETLRDFTAVSFLVASPHFEKALELTATRVTGATFDPKVVAAEKQIVLREISDRSTEAATVAYDTLWQTAFQTHPYRWPVGGTEETLRDITPAELEAHYRAFYVPNNMALVVVGDVEPEQVLGTAERLFGSLPRRELTWHEPAPEPAPDAVRTEVVRRGIAATIVAMGFHSAGIGDKRAVCALDLLYTLLGEGDQSWLAAELVRRRQLALGATCDFLTQRYPGLFLITAVCAPNQELPLRQALLDKAKELCTTLVSQEDLDRAKRLLYTSFAFTNETFADQVGTIGFYTMIDSYKFAFEYTDLCNGITAEELRAVAQRYLDPDRRSEAILRPQSEGEPEASLPWPVG